MHCLTVNKTKKINTPLINIIKFRMLMFFIGEYTRACHAQRPIIYSHRFFSIIIIIHSYFDRFIILHLKYAMYYDRIKLRCHWYAQIHGILYWRIKWKKKKMKNFRLCYDILNSTRSKEFNIVNNNGRTNEINFSHLAYVITLTFVRIPFFFFL